MRSIYFDYCANTPVDPRVLDAYTQTVKDYMGNANSQHAFGFASHQRIADATRQIAQMLGVQEDEIIYTSGATESNNLAIKGIARASRHVGKHIISTALEHTSASACLTQLKEEGYEIDLLPLTKEGTIDLEELEDLLRSDTCLVSLSWMDSEVGIAQPIKEVSEILKSYPNCRLHIDATQAMGKMAVDFQYGDTISFAPHKFYGLNSCGILVKKANVQLIGQMSGGQSTTIYRAGTPDTAMAAACEKALELMLAAREEDILHVRKLNQLLRSQIQQKGNIVINSPASASPFILNISIPGVYGYQAQKQLDAMGFCVSVKSACSSNMLPSKAVFALTRNRRRALESFRISIGKMTTEEEIMQLAEALQQVRKEESIHE